MKLYILGILTAMIALTGIFSPVSPTSFWRGRMFNHFGAANPSLLSRMHCCNISFPDLSFPNLSSPDIDFWSEWSWGRNMFFDDIVPYIWFTARHEDPEGEKASQQADSQPGSAGTMNSPWTVSGPSEIGLIELLHPSLKWVRVGYLLDMYKNPLDAISFACIGPLVCVVIYWMGQWMVAQHRHRRLLQIVNHELLEFIRQIQTRETAIFKGMDMLAYGVKHRLSRAFQRILGEQQKEYAGFINMLEREVNAFRQRLQLQAQLEFQTQAFRVRGLVAGAERTRQLVLDEIQGLRERVNELRRRVELEAESYNTAANPRQQSNSMLSSSTTRRAEGRPEYHPRSTTEFDRLAQKKSGSAIDGRRRGTEMDRAEPKEREGLREPLPRRLEQWKSFTSSRTPGQFEKGRRVRRERIERRHGQSNHSERQREHKKTRRPAWTLFQIPEIQSG